jgi:hypothetical protein
VEIKGKGLMETYFLVAGPAFQAGGESWKPPSS